MATKIPPRYRFTLADRTVAATRSVIPVWKDDLALEYQREQGQMFFRRKLNGKLTFVGADAEWILQRGYSHEIGVTMDRSDDNGVVWSEYWVGHFYMTGNMMDGNEVYSADNWSGKATTASATLIEAIKAADLSG